MVITRYISGRFTLSSSWGQEKFLLPEPGTLFSLENRQEFPC